MSRFLYHGTTEAAWERIQIEGLRPNIEGVFLTSSLRCADFYAWMISATMKPRDGSDPGKGVTLKIDVTGLGRMEKVREPICDLQRWPDFRIYSKNIRPDRAARRRPWSGR